MPPFTSQTALGEVVAADPSQAGGPARAWARPVNHDRADLRSRDDVARLVRSFYRDAAMDDRLGPIFSAARVDWPAHIERLTDFWCWQLLGERSYTGNPLSAHVPVHGRTPFTDAHFERWLELFTATVDDHFRGPTADMAKRRATKMATALRRLLAGGSGDAATPVSVLASATGDVRHGGGRVPTRPT